MHPTVETMVQNIRSTRATAMLTYLSLVIVTDRPADHDVRPSNATLRYAIPAWNAGHWRVSKLLLSPRQLHITSFVHPYLQAAAKTGCNAT